MLRKVVLALVVMGILSVFGLAQASDDGSVPWPVISEDEELGLVEPEPQIAWRGCCSPTWEVPGTRRVIFNGPMCLYTIRCAIYGYYAGDWVGTFWVRIEEVQKCCYKGWKVAGICVSIDSSPTCWWAQEKWSSFLGCGCNRR